RRWTQAATAKPQIGVCLGPESLMDELKPKSGRGQDTGGGLRAPAKGESSSSEVPLSNDGATFIEPPPRRPPADPGATFIQPDASREGNTSVRTPSAPRPYLPSFLHVS